MAQANMKAKMSLDTAGVSAGLSRIQKKAKGAVDTLGGAVPVLGQMTTQVGLIAAGVASTLDLFQRWRQEIERANNAAQSTSQNALQVTTQAGLAGSAGLLRTAATSASNYGTLDANQLITSFGQFAGENPNVGQGEIIPFISQIQRSATAGFDSKVVSEFMGVLRELGGYGVAESAEIASMLSAALGAEASRGPRLLRRLANTLPIDDAIQVLLQTRELGKTGQSKVFSRLEATQGLTSNAAQAIVAREGGGVIDFSERIDATGFIDNFTARQFQDDNIRNAQALRIQQNRTTFTQEANSDLNFAVEQEAARTATVGQSRASQLIAQGQVLAGGRPGGNNAADELYVETVRIITRQEINSNRALTNEED